MFLKMPSSAEKGIKKLELQRFRKSEDRLLIIFHISHCVTERLVPNKIILFFNTMI